MAQQFHSLRLVRTFSPFELNFFTRPTCSKIRIWLGYYRNSCDSRMRHSQVPTPHYHHYCCTTASMPHTFIEHTYKYIHHYLPRHLSQAIPISFVSNSSHKHLDFFFSLHLRLGFTANTSFAIISLGQSSITPLAHNTFII